MRGGRGGKEIEKDHLRERRSRIRVRTIATIKSLEFLRGPVLTPTVFNSTIDLMQPVLIGPRVGPRVARKCKRKYSGYNIGYVSV